MKSSIQIAYILCAGMGTRMGPLGKELPKVMWPIFEGTMLGLQINYAKSLGIKKIFLNTHHCADVIKKYLEKENFENVEIIHEDELLDVGGAVHNLKVKKQVSEKVLILNGDQFLFSNMMHTFLENAATSTAHATLLEIKVEKGEKYNRLAVTNGQLKAIIQAAALDAENYPTTYSGVSVVDLRKIDYVSGKSSFFKTVANFEKVEVECALLENYEYWDFGTYARFIDCHKLIIGEILSNKKKSLFVDFIINQKALNLSRIHQQNTYNSKVEHEYLFSEEFNIKGSVIQYLGKKFNQV